jgi:cellulose synthase/poly-beta-1,6-N-acetylglucosamine synthase-like glycosyltransferase
MIAIFVFLGCVILAFYIMAGYPLLLAVLAQRYPRPVRSERLRKSVTVIVPAYNGELYIADKLRSVLSLDYPRELLEILVVSDGSTDSTEAIVQGFAPQGVQLIRLPRGGKCAALNAAIPRAKGELLLLTDVRQSLAPDSLQCLVDCFADPTVGTVSGELVIRQGATLEEINVGIYWRYETAIRDRLSTIDSIFGATGPFYAMRTALAVPIPQDMLLDDMYLPLSAFFSGYRLIMEKRARAYDYPTSLQTEFRRKVRTLGGNFQILRAYPALLGPANRMWFHFVSYKVGRLLLPWLLLTAAAASFALPYPWRQVMLLAQAGFYGLAALDLCIPAAWTIKRLTSAVRAFIVMMIAAVCAISVFFVPPRRLWKVTSASAGQASPGR